VSFVLLGISVALLAYAAVILLGTALALPLFLRARRLNEPARRARLLVASRVLPSAFALLVVAGFVVPAFLWLEPRDTGERVSATMAALAGVGALMLLVGPIRGLMSVLSTRRLLKRWSGAASIDVPGITLPAFVVSDPFPIVSLVGWFRPRLLVAGAVLESCDGDELAAVLAHEAGHHERRDPWVRLLLRACPDLLSMTPWADRIERLWAEAAEQDADERAARTGPTRAMDLASALVKVARLAGAKSPPAIPVAALYRGDGVAGRVARLLELDPQTEGKQAPTRIAAGFCVLALLAFVPTAAALGLHHRVHGILETLVTVLQ
jgi:Zn-dependent protease with chaperone function